MCPPNHTDLPDVCHPTPFIPHFKHKKFTCPFNQEHQDDIFSVKRIFNTYSITKKEDSVSLIFAFNASSQLTGFKPKDLPTLSGIRTIIRLLKKLNFASDMSTVLTHDSHLPYKKQVFIEPNISESSNNTSENKKLLSTHSIESATFNPEYLKLTLCEYGYAYNPEEAIDNLKAYLANAGFQENPELEERDTVDELFSKSYEENEQNVPKDPKKRSRL